MDREQRPDNDRRQELFPLDSIQPETAPSAASPDLHAIDAVAAEKEQMSFEEALHRLEQTVARLESPDITLDESLKLFQEGTRLSRLCSELLGSIEHRITQLVDTPNGGLQEIPFSGEAE